MLVLANSLIGMLSAFWLFGVNIILSQPIDEMEKCLDSISQSQDSQKTGLSSAELEFQQLSIRRGKDLKENEFN
ncbi:hypothetical protein [Baaleninema sp.]|uniref:hypothetical protein n=1 Tax=Baaleninema sp. TaxID=3101197 RepID=UPI003CFBF1A6